MHLLYCVSPSSWQHCSHSHIDLFPLMARLCLCSLSMIPLLQLSLVPSAQPVLACCTLLLPSLFPFTLWLLCSLVPCPMFSLVANNLTKNPGNHQTFSDFSLSQVFRASLVIFLVIRCLLIASSWSSLFILGCLVPVSFQLCTLT